LANNMDIRNIAPDKTANISSLIENRGSNRKGEKTNTSKSKAPAGMHNNTLPVMDLIFIEKLYFIIMIL